MANKQFDNDSNVQMHEGASQANSVSTTNLAVDAILTTDYRTADIPNSIITVCNVTAGEISRFAVENGAINTTAIYANANITGTKDTATKLNVYIEAGVYSIQNSTVGIIDVTLSIDAIGVDFK